MSRAWACQLPCTAEWLLPRSSRTSQRCAAWWLACCLHTWQSDCLCCSRLKLIEKLYMFQFLLVFYGFGSLEKEILIITINNDLGGFWDHHVPCILGNATNNPFVLDGGTVNGILGYCLCYSLLWHVILDFGYTLAHDVIQLKKRKKNYWFSMKRLIGHEKTKLNYFTPIRR